MKDLHDVHLANRTRAHIGFHETGPELRAQERTVILNGIHDGWGEFLHREIIIDGWQQKAQKMQSNTNMFRSVNSYYDDNKTKP